VVTLCTTRGNIKKFYMLLMLCLDLRTNSDFALNKINGLLWFFLITEVGSVYCSVLNEFFFKTYMFLP